MLKADSTALSHESNAFKKSTTIPSIERDVGELAKEPLLATDSGIFDGRDDLFLDDASKERRSSVSSSVNMNDSCNSSEPGCDVAAVADCAVGIGTFSKSKRSLTGDQMVNQVLQDYYVVKEEPPKPEEKKSKINSQPKPLIAQALLPKSRRASSSSSATAAANLTSPLPVITSPPPASLATDGVLPPRKTICTTSPPKPVAGVIPSPAATTIISPPVVNEAESTSESVAVDVKTLISSLQKSSVSRKVPSEGSNVVAVKNLTDAALPIRKLTGTTSLSEPVAGVIPSPATTVISPPVVIEAAAACESTAVDVKTLISNLQQSSRSWEVPKGDNEVAIRYKTDAALHPEKLTTTSLPEEIADASPLSTDISPPVADDAAAAVSESTAVDVKTLISSLQKSSTSREVPKGCNVAAAKNPSAGSAGKNQSTGNDTGSAILPVIGGKPLSGLHRTSSSGATPGRLAIPRSIAPVEPRPPPVAEPPVVASARTAASADSDKSAVAGTEAEILSVADSKAFFETRESVQVKRLPSIKTPAELKPERDSTEARQKATDPDRRPFKLSRTFGLNAFRATAAKPKTASEDRSDEELETETTVENCNSTVKEKQPDVKVESNVIGQPECESCLSVSDSKAIFETKKDSLSKMDGRLSSGGIQTTSGVASSTERSAVDKKILPTPLPKPFGGPRSVSFSTALRPIATERSETSGKIVEADAKANPSSSPSTGNYFAFCHKIVMYRRVETGLGERLSHW